MEMFAFFQVKRHFVIMGGAVKFFVMVVFREVVVTSFDKIVDPELELHLSTSSKILQFLRFNS